jgi:hypothetical protein
MGPAAAQLLHVGGEQQAGMRRGFAHGGSIFENVRFSAVRKERPVLLQPPIPNNWLGSTLRQKEDGGKTEPKPDFRR